VGSVTDSELRLAAIVVTHQSAAFLPACLDSLAERAHGLDMEVVVSDSGSSDRVEEICREREATFLGGPNRGFGAAVNRALGHDAVEQARYVLVMNPDLKVVDGSLDQLVELAEQRPGCGVLAPRQVDQHGRLVCSIGREPSPADSWLAWRTGWSDWIWDADAYEREARCDWVMGSFMLLRRELLEAVGGFDEQFFLFSEEVDVCTRARRAGWEVAYLPQLTVMHWEADRGVDEHRERMIVWSQLLYARKWYRRRERVAMRAALLARLTRQLLRRLRRREAARSEWVRLGAALRFRRREYGPADGSRSPRSGAARRPLVATSQSKQLRNGEPAR
jgi:N-acetylglucosaminyl-diphospho-decaprenol L-rhamnosyltransferase